MKLILGKWDSFLEEKLKDTKLVKIISPSFSMITIKLLDSYRLLPFTELITRYSLYDFFVKLSDLQALKFGLQNSMTVFGLKNLHCKIYIFDDSEAIITSSNFTYGGIYRNHECGVFVTDTFIVGELLEYFNQMKTAGKLSLNIEQCEKWEEELRAFHTDILTPYMMPDYGEEFVQL